MRPAVARAFGRRLIAALSLLACAAAVHADPLGLYIGAGVGAGQIHLDQLSFDEHQTGWKAMVGLRPIHVLGVELEYIDFGHPNATTSSAQVDAHVRGAALSALLYAPLPVPDFDLYAKGGFSRLQTTASGALSGVGTCTINDPNCALFSFDRTDTHFAFGAGAQFKIAAFAIRGEYQHFESDVGNPSFWSLALTWSF
ncbi:MAG TPA: outer membrane beta-barrel protein [Steroidobacteraceae bacterium]|nr:outer membrane beta-barrel protein [Steroidobacteraceae bacterium]